MFVRKTDDIRGTEKELTLKREGGSLRSARILTKEDGCGFSISDILVEGSWSIDLHYKNHVEMNFIVTGHGEVRDLSNGESWALSPGTLYVVGPKDRHSLSTQGYVHLISIFNPAITGTESHDADGAFEPTGEIPPAWRGEAGRTMFVMREEDARKVILGGGRTRASRYLNRDDGCGLTISFPRGSAGNEAILWYKHHVEANYILEGEATVEDLTTGEIWELGPGSLYVVGPRDRHRLKAKTDIYLMSIFNPALIGDETHDADGSYPPSGDVPSAWRV
ncbi:MAG: ectoine synthase [Dehalococcoidia bacterium]